MGGIRPCSKQPSDNGGQKSGLGLDARDNTVLTDLYYTSYGSGGRTTITSTVTITLFATAISAPVPTTTTTTTIPKMTTSVLSSSVLGTPISTSSPLASEPSTLSILPSTTVPNPFDTIPPSSSPTPSSTTHANSGLPAPAIIGIVIAGIILLFIFAFYFAWQRRKWFRRQGIGGLEDQSQVDPTANLTPHGGQLANDVAGLPDRPRTAKLAVGGHRVSYGTHLTVSDAGTSSPLRRSRSSSAGVRKSDPTCLIHDATDSRRNLLIYSPTSGLRCPIKATVVNTFVRELSDELLVALGYRLDILSEYDDGWALCINEKGEQGVVPIECLAVDKGDAAS